MTGDQHRALLTHRDNVVILLPMAPQTSMDQNNPTSFH
jgi:hypothetical protein